MSYSSLTETIHFFFKAFLILFLLFYFILFFFFLVCVCALKLFLICSVLFINC